jgi:hypothetical protein
MSRDLAAARREASWARYLPGQRAGHYESFFLRGNHPARPLAFWIRYTLFSPAGRAEAAEAELWAIFFDGETGEHVAVKEEVPLARARFERTAFHVAIDAASGPAELGPGRLDGAAASGGHRVGWALRYRGEDPPLFLLPLGLYDAPLPKAKSLVGVPLATFEGALSIDGREVDVGGWVGSQNHNWGSKHTDHYAWGQVAGFDGHPGSFLELATARLKLGPVWTPFLTLLVLRHDGDEIALNTLGQAARAAASIGSFTSSSRLSWRFASETEAVGVEGRIDAAKEDFIGLSYRNPPGGAKDCLNTKIATAELTVTHKAGPGRGRVERLVATRRAAFEILTDDRGHGVPIRA